MAKINKVINVKVEGVGKIKQLEDSLKKLRKQQRDIKKDMKDGANAGKHAEQQYKKNENAIKGQSKALRDTKKAMVDANNTTKKSNNLQKSMTMGVIKGAAAFSILITAFRRVNSALTTMIGTFTEFEFTMAKVRAVSGATEQEFTQLTSQARELGRTTFFTASQVANLQLNLSKLGFTVQEIEQATQATINLSIATGSDLARAATVAGNAVRGFQLDASETERVVDIMAVAFTSSALDIEKWQTSMTKVAPIATMAGFSIEETTAIMAKLADTGIEASIAGTSLRNILLKMQDPTSELTRKVGHTIHNLDDMLKVFKDMQEEGTDLADVLTFMDVRQVAAFGTMLSGAEDIQSLVLELENAEGAGQDMADTVGDTLQGSIYRVKSALGDLSIELVSKFGGSLKKSMFSVAEWIDQLIETPGKLEKIVKWLKNTVRLLLAYKIGMVAARIKTKLFTNQVVVGFAASTTATRGFTGALVAFRVATTAAKLAFQKFLAATGIGLLVILATEALTAWLLSVDAAEAANIAAEKAIEKQKEFFGDLYDESSMKNAFGEATLEMEVVTKQYEELIKQKKIMNHINDKIAKGQGEEAVQLEALKKAQGNYNVALKSTNKFLKEQNETLLTEKSTLDDITGSLTAVSEAYFAKAIAQEFSSSQSKLISKMAEAQLALQTYGDEIGYEFSTMTREEAEGPGPGDEDYEYNWEDYIVGGQSDYKTTVYAGESLDELMTYNAELAATYRSMAIEYRRKLEQATDEDLALADLYEGYANQFMWSNIQKDGPEGGMSVEELSEAANPEAFEKRQQLLQQIYANLATGKGLDLNTLLRDLNTTPEGDGDKGNPYKATMEELITEAQATVNQKLPDFDLKVSMLEEKANAIAKFLKQKGVEGTEAETKAKFEQNKNLAALDEARFKQKLNSLTLELEADKIAVKERHLGKTEELAELNELDNQFLINKQQAAIDNNLALEDIENQIAKENLEKEELELEAKVQKLEDQYKNDQLALDLALANKEISETDHMNFMLQLDWMYLTNKLDLYNGHADEMKQINNELKENNVETIQAQMEATQRYVSSLGNLGQQMQDLAGDEEKLAGLRKVGVVITQAAATAETILSIANTMTELSIKKKNIQEAIDVSMTGKVVAANLKKIASNISAAASGFIATISSAAKSIPFPFNLIAIGLTVGAIYSAYRKIKGSFGGGGGADSTSSSGGGGSSSGGGSGGGSSSGYTGLMTFGGQHTTMGTVSQYADGGMVHGKSHNQGGEKFAVGGRVVELEGGEAVINKRSTSMFKSQLSAMNYAGGGVSFADGGITNTPSFAQTQFQVSGQQNMNNIAAQKSKVVVVEADITNSQNKVTAIESEASF